MLFSAFLLVLLVERKIRKKIKEKKLKLKSTNSKNKEDFMQSKETGNGLTKQQKHL